MQQRLGPLKADTLNRLRRNDRAMIRWICNVKAKDEVSSDSLLTKLGIQDLDMLSAGGGCALAAITRCKCAWGKFRQLLPLLTNRQVPLLTRGKVYSSCVRSVMLHAAETWAMKADTLNRLRRNDRAMIRWICNVKAKDEVSSDSLLTKLGIQDLDVVLRTGRMRWFGHIERSTGWISEVRKLNVVAQKRSGRPRKSWDEVIKNDRKKLDMDSADPQNRSEWRGRLRGRLVKKPNPR